jgi:hypothetical protein
MRLFHISAVPTIEVYRFKTSCRNTKCKKVKSMKHSPSLKANNHPSLQQIFSPLPEPKVPLPRSLKSFVLNKIFLSVGATSAESDGWNLTFGFYYVC